jgi:hypothetical protein
MGVAYYSSGNKEQGIKCIQNAAELGYEPAKQWLCECDDTLNFDDYLTLVDLDGELFYIDKTGKLVKDI